MQSKLRLALAAVVFLTSAWTAFAQKSAAEALASIRATKAGVDASNNFWAWDRQRRVVTRISRDGNRVESDILPDDPWSADADQERGIVLLTDAGREIDIVDWSGSPKRSIRLRHMAPAAIVAGTGGLSPARQLRQCGCRRRLHRAQARKRMQDLSRR